MNESQAQEIWSILPHPSREHVVRVFAKRNTITRGDFARNSRELVRFANAASDLSVYVAPNPTTRTVGIRHNNEDVTHWSFFLIDIDPIEDDYIPNNALDEVLKILGGYCGHDLFKTPPNIIDSGRGIQVWCRTDDRELGEGENPFHGPIDRKIARRAMSYWLKKLSRRLGLIEGCKIDTSCSDLPRVMRMPYTINHKTHREATIIQKQEQPFPWLIPFLVAGTPAEVLYQPDTPSAGVVSHWQLVFTKLTKSAQEYILFGKEEPGRHQVAWHTAKSLEELGVSREQAEKAIYRANKLKGPDEELSDGELQHTLNTAYGSREVTSSL